jgi:diacylglycerol O-acyltransferase / wax synthase
MADFMRNSDAFAWDMEHDPGLRSTVVTVMLLERSPDWDLLVDRFERIGRLVPMFRQKVVESVPPAPPRWVYDPDFDLGYHLRRVIAPHPGTFDTVLEMARRAEMAEFDHARPLWEVTLVDELADGGAALVCKLHHSLTDGIGGMQIAMVLFDLTEEPADRGPLPPVPEPDEPGSLDGLRHLIRYDAGLVGKAAHGALRTAPAALLGGVRRPRRSVLAAAETAASVYRMVRPINRTASPIMQDRRLVRRLGVHDVPLDALKDAAHTAGGTLNDAFLAGVTGGLRRYHSEHGAAVGDLHVTMPVSIRGDDDPVGGNRLTLMRFTLPVGVVDPAERIKRIHERAGGVRHERSLPYTQLIAGGLNLLPRWYIAAILRHVDFLASDVPGIPVPVFLAGAPVRMQYAFGPTIGAGVNVTLMTFVDTCSLGINVDTGAIPDHEVFHRCLVAGFDEVLALAAPTVTPLKRARRPRTAAPRRRVRA